MAALHAALDSGVTFFDTADVYGDGHSERLPARLRRERDVGVIARIPLASGLLTGKLTRDTTFAPDDHRRFNRNGEEFDAGETFAGVDYETGVEVAEAMKELVPEGTTLAQLALRWVLM